jgi:prepilin-type N-terminal cleavage/methylation domain-containing protein
MEQKRAASGFSLVEILVVLAAVAILAGLATPAMVTWKQQQQLNGAAANLAADLEQAKMRAIRENAFVAVLFTAASYTIFVDNGAGSGEPGDWMHSGDEALVQQRSLPPGVQLRMTDLTLANGRVRFNGRGFPLDVAATASIPVESAQGTKEVTLSRLGIVRVN